MGVSAAAADLRGSLDRVLYRTRHYALTAGLALPRQLWSRILSPRQAGLDPAALGLLQRRFEALLERDLDCVARGVYPRELLFQLPLLGYLRQLPAALADLPRFLWRSYTASHQDLPSDIDRGRYPRYYLRTFHWQTDGWFSERSARLYDGSVEFLFGGTADIMRRMAIPPLVASLQAQARARILDVGCGTGRFLAQLQRALPSARLYGVDLSAAYLEKASELLTAQGASLVNENAEALPFADAHFDAASAVFLFHELPPDARRRVARELWRVLRPGARLVLCDSAQLSDSAELADVLRSFPAAYHEPYYKSYLRDDLAGLLRECGFELESSEAHFVSKVVVARKPGRARASRSAGASPEPEATAARDASAR